MNHRKLDQNRNSKEKNTIISERVKDSLPPHALISTLMTILKRDFLSENVYNGTFQLRRS